MIMNPCSFIPSPTVERFLSIETSSDRLAHEKLDLNIGAYADTHPTYSVLLIRPNKAALVY